MSRSRLAEASSRAARALSMVLAALPVVAAAALIPATMTEARADAPYFQLTETVVDPNVWPPGQWQLSDGALVLDLYADGAYTTQFNWASPPAAFDAGGFDITLNVSGKVKSACAPMAAGTGISGSSFEFTPDSGAPLNLTPPPNCDPNTAGGNSGSNSVSVHVKPSSFVSDGQTVEIKVGAFWGPGVTYRYHVTNTRPPIIGGGGGGGGGGMQGTLAATLECDSDTIVISALPSLNCHIVFTSWRRNTADPVEVSFPAELDTFGNHANGIQLIGRGSEDVFNWDSPHRWGLLVFACPSQQGTGANCYGSVTTPGRSACRSWSPRRARSRST